MRILRLAGAVVVVAGLVWTVSAARCRESPAPLMAPCSASALAAAYHGADRVDSVQNFGCVGGFAFLWATIGSGEQEIGVTEVLAFNVHDGAWRNASRLTYCTHHRLPRYVAFWGCNSN